MSTFQTFILVTLACAICACGGDNQPAPDPTINQCLATGEVCKGDNVCTSSGCEAAFPRDYQVAVASVSILGKPEVCIEDPECPIVPEFAVFFSGATDSILNGERSTADIHVEAENFLIVEVGEFDCVVELTPSVLRGGFVECNGARHAVALSLAAL